MTYWIFEIANNHNGSVEHAKLIINEFARISYGRARVGIKLQFRQLDSFIHADFVGSDLPYVKRFNSTRLEFKDFEEIVQAIRNRGLDVIATPFDNESLVWIEDLDVDIVKVASCSIDDWPLLRAMVKLDRRFIISTAGASMETLDKVYSLFLSHGRNFAFMHCVGEYPTEYDRANLKRIDQLRARFPGIEIGISTHEPATEFSVVPLALAKGCTIVEKHVGIATDEVKLNPYTMSVRDIFHALEEARLVEAALEGEPKDEAKALAALKRGIYAARSLRKGTVVLESDLYYAMPCQDGQANVSMLDEIVGHPIREDVAMCAPVPLSACREPEQGKYIDEIKGWLSEAAERYDVPLVPGDEVEISCHHGLDRFEEVGALIVNKVNRAYCKKLIFMMAGQRHPTHHHVKKEEAFELLGGDCTLVLNGREIPMERGRPYVITRGTQHSFSSVEGCVIEEVSTTHIPGDSVYEDPDILKKRLDERKVIFRL